MLVKPHKIIKMHSLTAISQLIVITKLTVIIILTVIRVFWQASIFNAVNYNSTELVDEGQSCQSAVALCITCLDPTCPWGL